jgi:hypothetical protein
MLDHACGTKKNSHGMLIEFFAKMNSNQYLGKYVGR